MAGYAHDYSRSNNSIVAIANNEVPKTMIKRVVVDEAVESFDFTEDEKALLKATPVKVWKIAAENVGPSSWHHTSSWYNETDHYDLELVARAILDGRTTPEGKKAKHGEFAAILVQVWGGTRNHPKLIGTETHAGTVKGAWLVTAAGKRFKLAANKTLKVTYTDTMAAAVKVAAEMEN